MIEPHDAGGQGGQSPTDGADSHTQCSHDTYIELLQLGRLSGRRRLCPGSPFAPPLRSIDPSTCIGGSGALGDLLFDHPDQLFIRGPERLANANRVIDDFGDRGIPIAAFPIVKNTVSADHQVIGISTGERGDNLEFLSCCLAHDSRNKRGTLRPIQP